MTPSTLMRLSVGLRPTMPQREAGIRIEPPVSVPMLPKQRPAAMEAADPLLEPPGIRERSHGLWTGRSEGCCW